MPHLRPALATLAMFTSLGLPAQAASNPADTAPPQTEQAERSGAHPRSDNSAEELGTVIVSAIPGQQDANKTISPVSVLAGAELDAARATTLGQTVSSVPGVQTSAFGAGAGRPVIRGADGPRVSVLSNGLGTQDVSSVSQDHAVSLEPFLADQIEILKGPSTLLFGSGAIGGVINVVDGRIPERAPENGLQGRLQLGHDTASDGNVQMFRVDTGNQGFVLHADGLDRDNGNYSVPGGTLANSFVRTKAGALGTSWLGERGFLGVSVSRFLDAYGNPAEPGDPAEGEPAVRVQMEQTREELKGVLRSPFAGLERAELSFGHTSYQHVELEGDEVGTRFVNHANEARLLLNHEPLAGWQGAFGLQGFDRAFKAVGDESFVPPTASEGMGLFLTEQREFGKFKVELGARADRQSSAPQAGARRDFRPLSLSAGLSWRIDDVWHLTFNLDRAQRAPAEEELFANGPHLASATFEIGDPALAKETANQMEAGLHFHGDWVDAKVAAFVNRYSDFIYLADTGEVEADLPVRLWSQADAKFRGGEAEVTLHLSNNPGGHYDLRFWGDAVHARLQDGSNLPRIPAARFGSTLSWKNEFWRASLGAVHYFRQNRNAPLESTTSGFTLLNAHLAWNFFSNDRSDWEAFLDADNLGNQTARLSTSLIKDLAPLPGRNFSVGIRSMF